MHEHLGSIILRDEVATDDGLPKQICLACKTQLEALERAEEDGVAFTEMAKSYRALVVSSRPIKHTKVLYVRLSKSAGEYASALILV